MRFYLGSIERAKRVSKSLKKHFEENNLLMSLSRSQALVARIYGYRDWHELAASIGSAPASLDDSELSHTELVARFVSQRSILIEEGIPGELATSVLEAVHPTGSAPTKSSDLTAPKAKWAKTDAGFIGELEGKRYLVRQTDENDVLMPDGWVVMPDIQNLIMVLGNGSTAEAAIKDFERRRRQADIADAEVKAKNRPSQDLEEGEGPMTHWGPSRRATEYAPGIVSYETDKHTYLVLSAERLSQIPEEFRLVHEDGDSELYLQQDAGQAILLCFPEVLTDSERAYAEKHLKRDFPNAFKRLKGDKSPDTVRKAKNEIVGPREEWVYMNDEPDHDPDFIKIHAVRSSYWGADCEEIIERDRDVTFVFRVARSEFESWGGHRTMDLQLESAHHEIVARY